MLLIKSNKNTPGTRWKFWINFKKLKFTNPNKYKNLIKFSNNLNNNKILKNKIFNKQKFITVKTHIFKVTKNNIVLDYILNNFINKKYVVIKNYYNLLNTYPKTNLIYPGFTINKFINNIKLSNLEYYFNSFITLISVPINFSIFYIFNINNFKPTYSLSDGCNAVRKKLLKKTKFILVMLPSKKIKYCLTNTLCLFSPNKSNKNKLVSGKFGLSLTKSKKLVVRGVAKNPIDHPNGGRTKAKQPEKSPWGWVAKLNK